MAVPSERVRELEQATVLIYEHIKLADQKALVFIALNGGLVGGLYGIRILESPHINLLNSLSAFSLLLVGMALALVTIKPRRGEHAKKLGVIDPYRIAQYKNGNEYRERLAKMSEDDFEEELTDRIYDLSIIDRSKYRWLAWSIFISSIAWAFSLCIALFHSLHPSTTNCPGTQ